MRHRTLLVAYSRFALLAMLGACTDLPADDRPAALHEITISSIEYSYVAPDTVPAGLTRVRLTNNGKEDHHAQLARLHPGHTVAELRDTLAAGTLPSWVTFVGGPNHPARGASSEVIVRLEPGSYAVLCFVPSADRIPHLAKGMIRELVVVPWSGGAQATPRADAVMVLDDYTFTLTPSLTAGRRTVRVENRGPQPHEVVIVRLQPGKTAADVLAWLGTREGPPPGEAFGGTVALQTKEVNYVVADFTRGDYVLICFVPDAGDGRGHVAHGMVSQIKVN